MNTLRRIGGLVARRKVGHEIWGFEPCLIVFFCVHNRQTRHPHILKCILFIDLILFVNNYTVFLNISFRNCKNIIKSISFLHFFENSMKTCRHKHFISLWFKANFAKYQKLRLTALLLELRKTILYTSSKFMFSPVFVKKICSELPHLKLLKPQTNYTLYNS